MEGGRESDCIEIEVPFSVLENLVVKAIIDKKISELDDMSTEDILYK